MKHGVVIVDLGVRQRLPITMKDAVRAECHDPEKRNQESCPCFHPRLKPKHSTFPRRLKKDLPQPDRRYFDGAGVEIASPFNDGIRIPTSKHRHLMPAGPD